MRMGGGCDGVGEWCTSTVHKKQLSWAPCIHHTTHIPVQPFLPAHASVRLTNHQCCDEVIRLYGVCVCVCVADRHGV